MSKYMLRLDTLLLHLFFINQGHYFQIYFVSNVGGAHMWVQPLFDTQYI